MVGGIISVQYILPSASAGWVMANRTSAARMICLMPGMLAFPESMASGKLWSAEKRQRFSALGEDCGTRTRSLQFRKGVNSGSPGTMIFAGKSC